MTEIRRIRCGNANCYLLKNGEDGVLVDTGKREFLDRVLASCRDCRVRLILLTHAHFDHAENTARLAQSLGAPVAMGEADRDLISSNNSQSLSAETIPGKLVLALSLRAFSSRAMLPWVPDVLLRQGDSLRPYGIDGEAIALPGHTKGSFGVDVEGRHLIVGDALMNMFYPTVSMLYHDRIAMLESAGRIGAMGPRTVWFGHGGPVENRRWVR